MTLADGARIELDGATADLSVLCEAWAHQGRAKPAQKSKLLTDAFKLSLAAKVTGGTPRLILLVSDEEAIAHLRGRSWGTAALRHFGIELFVVDVPDETRAAITAAQQRQVR